MRCPGCRLARYAICEPRGHSRRGVVGKSLTRSEEGKERPCHPFIPQLSTSARPHPVPSSVCRLETANIATGVPRAKSGATASRHVIPPATRASTPPLSAPTAPTAPKIVPSGDPASGGSPAASAAASNSAFSAASAASVATSAASSAATAASSAAGAALAKLMQLRDAGRQRKQDLRRASAVAAHIQRRIRRPHHATTFPPGRLLMLSRVPPSAAKPPGTSCNKGGGRAARVEVGGDAPRSPALAEAQDLHAPVPHHHRGASGAGRLKAGLMRRGREGRGAAAAGGGWQVGTAGGQGGNRHPATSGRGPVGASPGTAARDAADARAATDVSSAAAAAGTDPPDGRTDGASAGGWRLQPYDRREMAVLDVRQSMLRDHSFDRYDLALRAVRASAPGAAGVG
eukprot:scaffold7297_cov125-Isochrysis_galbana.AAC.2